MEDNTLSLKLALLIDADNTSPKLISEIISEVGKYGKITIRRSYGDFTNIHLINWKDILNTYAIRPVQKFAYTYGKNSTDSALIIDAMDIMHDGLVNGFCIASSDSDYTGLALRIREQGLFVIGIGKSETPQAFQRACEIFVFTENLQSQKRDETDETKPEENKDEYKAKTPKLRGLKILGSLSDLASFYSKIDKQPLDTQQLDKAVDMAMDIDGLAYMGDVAAKLRTIDPTFDPRTYGFETISLLFKSLPNKYELIYRQGEQSRKIVYVKRITENSLQE
ncbi:MAG: NYN domain-containing protein [Flavobacteriales bacterium]|nr:NYN domain-containing protein [Flavobacteriales bacterium]